MAALNWMLLAVLRVTAAPDMTNTMPSAPTATANEIFLT